MNQLTRALALLLFFLSSSVMAVGGHEQTTEEKTLDNKISNDKAAAEQTNTVKQPAKPIEWKDTVVLTIPADGDKKYKVYLAKDVKFDYVWEAQGKTLFFDLHGEPRGDRTGYFRTFDKGIKPSVKGSLISEFEGTHGWYWQNTSDSEVVIILKMAGDYQRLDIEVDQQTAEEYAKAILESLIKRDKVEGSWMTAQLGTAEKKEFKGQLEWVVTFLNRNVMDKDKQKLYIFLTLSGVYIAANFSGE